MASTMLYVDALGTSSLRHSSSILSFSASDSFHACRLISVDMVCDLFCYVLLQSTSTLSMLRACHAPSNSSLSDSGNLSKAWPRPRSSGLDAFIVLVDWVRGCDFSSPKVSRKIGRISGTKAPHLSKSLVCEQQLLYNIISVLWPSLGPSRPASSPETAWSRPWSGPCRECLNHSWGAWAESNQLVIQQPFPQIPMLLSLSM